MMINELFYTVHRVPKVDGIRGLQEEPQTFRIITGSVQIFGIPRNYWNQSSVCYDLQTLEILVRVLPKVDNEQLLQNLHGYD